MKKITRTATTLAVGLGLAGFLAMGASLPAHADDSHPSADVGAGILAYLGTTPSDFTLVGGTAIKLNGSALNPTADFTIGGITDPTGSGAGWNLSLTASRFTDAATDTLPANALSVTAVPTAVPGTSSGAAPDVADSTTLSGDLSAHPTTPVKLITADGTNGTGGAQGMGSYTFTGNLTLALAIPANTLIGNYTSTVTITLASGDL